MGGFECRATGSKIAMLRFFENENFVRRWLSENHTIQARRRVLCRLPYPPASGTTSPVRANGTESCDDNCPATANRAESCAFQSTKSVFLRVKHEKPESSSQSISQSINDAARWLNDMNECVNE